MEVGLYVQTDFRFLSLFESNNQMIKYPKNNPKWGLFGTL